MPGFKLPLVGLHKVTYQLSQDQYFGFDTIPHQPSQGDVPIFTRTLINLQKVTMPALARSLFQSSRLHKVGEIVSWWITMVNVLVGQYG